MTTKLAHYVADFIAQLGVRHVFAVSGGASLHMIHAVSDHPALTCVTPHHEQAAAMAADGYARSSGGFGVAIATSGPGATNLITGIGCSYYDSVPVLYLTGQVSTFRMVGETGVRQIGFQETPIVGMCRAITNYAVEITDPADIRYELEKAVYLARSGRLGPVLVDIPDNFQRAMIEVESLRGFVPPPTAHEADATHQPEMTELLNRLRAAHRPVLILGWGIHLAGAAKEALEFAEALNLPVALTWGAADVVPADHPLYIGTFGTHGVRHASFAVQNADFILAVGARLDTKATGTPVNSFARAAYKAMVDIDAAELHKFPHFGLTLDCPIHMDANDFFTQFTSAQLAAHAPDTDDWQAQIARWREQFAALDGYPLPQRGRVREGAEKINPYALMTDLSAALPPAAKLFVDTGCAVAWAMQGLRLKTGQRVFHDCNNTAMGWALPAVIGSWFAHPETLPIVMVGDGSFMMTLYELATAKHHRMPLKLILLDNQGYAMIRQTQDQWLGGKYYASSHAGGLSFPDYAALAAAFGMEYRMAETQRDAATALTETLAATGAVFCHLRIPPDAKVIPQVRFGCPNEDMEPLLPREVFHAAMVVEPVGE